MSRVGIVVGSVLLASACGETAPDPNVVARAGDHELTVDDVVRLLVDEERLPTEASVVESLADLWIDYTLLAQATLEDTTYSQLDLMALVRHRVDQEMIGQLRDSVIQVDTVISDDELRTLYAAESPEVELHARHIMMTYPLEATPAQRDSVRAALSQIRARILAGARFEDMALQFSQDPGSSSSGGDLGIFARGDMVQPFEEAVLALQPGQLSDVVETPMGLHIIRLEDRRVRDFEDVGDAFRVRVLQQRNADAESTFVARLEGGGLEVTPDAYEVARELARNPTIELSRRASRRALVSWQGGDYSAGELLELLQFEQPTLRERVAVATDEELADFLRDVGRRDLLVSEARLSGLEPDRARVDSLTRQVGGQLLAAADAIGLRDIERAPGEETDIALKRAVLRSLADNLSGATRVVPLGLVGFQLREGVPTSVNGAAVGRALLAIGQVRAGRSPSPIEQLPDSTAALTEPPR